MSHFEDEEHRRFAHWEGLGNPEGTTLSNAAFMMHTSGIMNSIKDGHPGFVSDDYLDAITAETTLTALELCTAKLWRRCAGGYVVLDRESIELCLDALERVEQLHDDPEA